MLWNRFCSNVHRMGKKSLLHSLIKKDVQNLLNIILIKKKLLTLFQFISKSTFQHRCFSKNWYKRPMEVDVNLTQYHACLRLGVRPSPIWMAAELVNVTVSLSTRSCLVVQVIRQHVIRQLHGTVNFFKKKCRWLFFLSFFSHTWTCINLSST